MQGNNCLTTHSTFKQYSLKKSSEDFLVVQWLRIHLAMQGDGDGFDPLLGSRDPACHGTAKSVHRD